MRADLLKTLRQTKYPLAEAFAQREDPGVMAAALEKLKAETARVPKAMVE